ncbi:hypothetical protein GGI07_001767 [Coemansia sp. Benny D115]|nr:hypothetical protein GGI07_001767 [Coemansia sp. Benny D115]
MNMDSEALYWDRYDSEGEQISQATVPIHQTHYGRSSAFAYRKQPDIISSPSCVSSRDSYWSRYLGGGVGIGDGDSDQCTPTARADAGVERPASQSSRQDKQDMRRLLVVPEKLAALRLSDTSSNSSSSTSSNDDGGSRSNAKSTAAATSSMTAAAAAAVAAARQTGDVHADGSVGEQQSGVLAGGVNPMALITRLNFLKDQLEQDERLIQDSRSWASTYSGIGRRADVA